MSSSKDYRDFILEQLSEVPNITCRPMMGEFLLYADGILFGGIYDDRLLVKIVPGNGKLQMPEAIPYKNAKPMYFVEDVDDKEKLAEIIKATIDSLGALPK
jgi:TfoX/Sxy family transcriptional regulator of competence genes